MTHYEVGNAVIEQSQNNGVFNTEPAAATGFIVGGVAAVASILVLGGYIEPVDRDFLVEQAGVIVPACFVIAAGVQAIITRFKAWSGRSAARVAVLNAAKPAGAAPVLQSPP